MFNKVNAHKKDILTVADFLDQLKDCRPDAEVLISFMEGGQSLDKSRKIINHGNFVEIVRVA